MRETLSFEGAFRRGEDGPFQYLPFDVPPGARRLEVAYHFDREPRERAAPFEPDDVVDLGIFDTRGVDFLTGGFRGWSGSSRRSFFISPREATPGYLRGPLQAGTWHLFLGGRVLHSALCPYRVDVSLDIDPNAADPADSLPVSPVARAPRAGGGAVRWYRGDFHSHTVHSDGYNTVAEYVAEARRVGLDFVAITDHNTVSHFEEIVDRPRDGALLIPGEEVTTFWGHANVWGAGCWVDFRCTDDAGMQRILDFVHERGGLFSPNHPKASAGYPWEFRDVRGFGVAEIWQGAWRFYNHESLAFWEERLRRGERVVAVGGSDTHAFPPARFIHPWTIGNPCTWVYAEEPLSEPAVLDAVRAGHVFLSEDPTGPFLELRASCAGRSYLMGEVIDAHDGATVRLTLRYQGPPEKKLRLLRDGELWHEVVAETDDVTLEFDLRADAPGYLRAEATGFRGRPERGEVVHAMTNPIYLSVGATP